MKKGIQVSIIIVNYNTRELLYNCIQSILDNTRELIYEIIVVDNASADQSVEMLHQNFPSVLTIASKENLGFGKANNLGVEQAKGEYVFFLNSDTLLVNNAIHILYEFISHHEEVAVCGACLYDKTLRPNLSVVLPPSSWDEFSILLPKFMQKKQNIGYYHDKNFPQEVNCITGADMMVRKDIFLQAGRFDPDFFMYAEEVELTHRIKKKGYKVYLIPEAKIIHLEGMSAKTETLNQRVASEKLFSKFLYYQKVYGRSTVRQVHFYHKLKCVLALSVFSISKNKNKRTYWEQKYTLVESSYKKFKLSGL